VADICFCNPEMLYLSRDAFHLHLHCYQFIITIYLHVIVKLVMRSRGKLQCFVQSSYSPSSSSSYFSSRQRATTKAATVCVNNNNVTVEYRYTKATLQCTHKLNRRKRELSYRKQIARQLHTIR